ncbi:MAG: TPM domain-containing protein [Sphingobacteriia bacterium]|nr:TPM domain-containing protein [Sphingobacteriia bacterium]
MFSFFRKKSSSFFSEEEKQIITSAIQHAEQQTSGEVRVFIESKCSYVNAIDRAIELFGKLNMHQTKQRNGVLVYVAVKDRQLAVFGDVGIHEKVGNEFWNNAVQQMIQHFNKSNYALGIAQTVTAVGEALKNHFPYDAATDINELPDDIVFGK